MAGRQIVVDGSNLATEGRSLPSLGQLKECLTQFAYENPDDKILVIVDASFGHRIDPAERRAFEEAEAAGEFISPPAGAVGRGDGFLLQIADRTGATVLSNDSFQEFHGTYEWLFSKGRLVGGKPVPDLGWIFMLRNPVRGQKSQQSVKEAKRTKARIGSKEASAPMPVPKAPPPPAGRGGKKKAKVAAAIGEATRDVLEPVSDKAGRRRSRSGGNGGPPTEPVNTPLAFITFIADYRPGSEVDAEVDSFSSHGAFANVGGARCYIPLTALGDPPPRSAKEVLKRGEVRRFVVQAIDVPRRGIELALPEVVRVSGEVTEETVQAEIAAPRRARGGRGRAKPRAGTVSATATPVAEAAVVVPTDAPRSGPRRAPGRAGLATRTQLAKAAPAKKQALKKRAAAKPATKTPTKSTTKTATKIAAKPATKSAVTKATKATRATKTTKTTKATKTRVKATTKPATKATAKPATKPTKKSTPTKVSKVTKATKATRTTKAATKATKSRR